MVVGTGRLTGTETKTADDSEDTEDLEVSSFLGALSFGEDFTGSPLLFLVVRVPLPLLPEAFFLFTSASSASSAVLVPR